jgi:hypothetical protein
MDKEYSNRTMMQSGAQFSDEPIIMLIATIEDGLLPIMRQ